MVLTSPRSSFRPLTPVPTEWGDEREHRKILAQAVQQLQTRSLNSPIEVPAAQTANYTMTDADTLILVDATGGNKTITLLSAIGRKGRRVAVKKIDATANLVVIDAAGTETLDGSLTISLTQKNAVREWMSDNANWRLISAVGNATSL